LDRGVADHPIFTSLLQNMSRNVAAYRALSSSNLLSSILSFLPPPPATSATAPPLASTNRMDRTMDTIRISGPGLLTKTLERYFLDTCAHTATVGTVAGGGGKEANMEADPKVPADGGGGGAGHNLVVVAPIAFFHCVPNDVSVDLGDVSLRGGVLARYRTSDTLAVHWWQRSWQSNSCV
jgi:hypothetical protein